MEDKNDIDLYDETESNDPSEETRKCVYIWDANKFVLMNTFLYNLNLLFPSLKALYLLNK